MINANWNYDPIEKNQCFQRWKWNAFSLILPYFSHVFSALKVKCIQPNFAIFFMLFFSNSENATESKFRQETLNILRALKFVGSHLAFYEWKVSFSLISPIIFSSFTGKSSIEILKQFWIDLKVKRQGL